MRKTTLAIVGLLLLADCKVQASEIGSEIPDDTTVAVESDADANWGRDITQEMKSDVDGEDVEHAGFTEKYISGKLQVGTRMATRILTDSDSGHKGGTYGSGTYLGTIYAIDEIQDYVPSLLFVKYAFSDYISAELGYDSVSGETRATSIGYSETKSDGDINLYGPTLSLVARYPNSTKFSPYASVGVGFYFGDFDESAHWALGYKSESQYEAYGSPSTVLDGRTREMELDNSIGILLGLGCTYAVTDHWLLDLSMQYTKVDVDATFYGYTYGVLDTEQDGNFPMDNVAFRLGVAYQF